MAVSWRAPGRINLIGEHTDYNGGFVLPFAIEQGCTASVEIRSDDVVRVESVQLAGPVETTVAALQPGTGGWAGYVLGAVWALRERGIEVPGVEITVDSDVPVGAGLSSSAALVCAATTALDEALGLALGSDELLAVTRAVENDYVGAPTGGMDQLAALRCVAGHVLFCDMRSLQTEAVPFDLGPLSMLVVDTRAKHSHADGEYRQRRAGCEAAASALRVPALRDVRIEDLDAALARLDDEEQGRYTRHIVTEDDRVLRTVELLRAGRLADIGPLLTASHTSMRDDFRITGPELDLTVDTLLASGALGARMTGGGFGGCVIALVEKEQVTSASVAVGAAFGAAGFAPPVIFTASPAQGAHPVTD